MSRIMGELRVDGAAADYDEDDLLDLMDSAQWLAVSAISLILAAHTRWMHMGCIDSDKDCVALPVSLP